MAEEMGEQFQQLEEHYNQRSGPCYYKLIKHSDEDKGVYMVANCDISDADVLFVETSLHSQPFGNHPSVQRHPEFPKLMKQLEHFAKSHGHLTGEDRYPPEARKVMDRLTELNCIAFLTQSPNLEQVWELEDSHRQAQVGDPVIVDGLLSEGGKKLNGQQGQVTKLDDKDPSRMGVSLSTVVKSIKRNNIKTLGGICRTNFFESESDQAQHLFKNLCRVNHACGSNANITKIVWNSKAFVLAKRDIKQGEEILIDYLPGEKKEDRLGLLQLKYNFVCQCPLHK